MKVLPFFKWFLHKVVKFSFMYTLNIFNRLNFGMVWINFVVTTYVPFIIVIDGRT
jgi:hypothetical protein